MNRPRTQAETDIALHQFGQRMREAWDAKQAEFEKNFAAFSEGVREEWEKERSPIQEPKIEAPKIEPPTYDTRDKKPEEPDMDR